MTPLRRLHVGAYRRLVAVLPAAHRTRFGDAQVRLFADLLATGTSPWRLWARAVPDIAGVLIEHAHERNLVMSTTSRLALVPLSLVSALAGAALVIASLAVADIPVWMALPAAAVLVQGGFTLLWLGGRFHRAEEMARSLFVTGEAAALLVGGIALVAALGAQATSGDPEYGPLTVLTVVVVHGAVGLLFAATDRGAPVAGQN